MDPTIAAAIIGTVGGLAGAVSPFWASIRANRIAEAKVDGEALERAKTFYQDTHNDMQREIERLQAHVACLEQQLDTRNAQFEETRRHFAELEAHVSTLQAELERRDKELRQERELSNLQQIGLRALAKQVSELERKFEEMSAESDEEPPTHAG